MAAEYMAVGLEARLNVLESKVQELVDIEAIRDLRFRYHEYINEAKFTEIAGLFTEDGDLLFGHLGNAHGRDEINRFFGGLLTKPDGAGKDKPPRLSRVRQFIHNHMVEIRGDRQPASPTWRPSRSTRARAMCCGALRRRICAPQRSLEVQEDGADAVLHGAVEGRLGPGRLAQDGPLIG